MTCTRPIRLKKGLMVPCGYCQACRISRYTEWTTRILDECSYYRYQSFITLTYSDEYLPIDGGLCVSDPQGFIKRLRQVILRRNGSPQVNRSDPSKPLKYFLSGEYGEEFGRPHYHAIMMSQYAFDDVIEETWGKGRVSIDAVNPTTIDYVTRYVQKKLSGPMAEEVYGDRKPPFQLTSQGFGLRAALRDDLQLMTYGKTRNGKRVSIPKYYVKKLGIEDIVKNEAIKQELKSRADPNRLLADDLVPERAYVLSLWEDRAQRARNIKARMDLFKKRDIH